MKEKLTEMEKSEVKKILIENITYIKETFYVKEIGIFGSFVRGESGPKSDIDVLVEFKEGANLLHLSGLSLFLEDKIHIPVDIVPIDTIKKDLKEDILREAIYI